MQTENTDLLRSRPKMFSEDVFKKAVGFFNEVKYGHLSDQSRKIARAYAGRRDAEGPPGIWNSIPESCRKNAVFHSDFWSAYKEVFPLNGISLSESTAER